MGLTGTLTVTGEARDIVVWGYGVRFRRVAKAAPQYGVLAPENF